MKKLCLLFWVLLALSFSVKAQVSLTVVINEVYGGGGNSGSTFTNDFIELYNVSDVPVFMSNWTVQYASVSGSSWQKTIFSGIIQPHNYYLIQEAQGTGGTVPLPSPDAIGTIMMSATAGKVALVNNSTTLTGTCPTGLVDFVGFGAANCSETSPTAALSNTTSAQRTPIGQDTGNNSADFLIGAPSPRPVPDVIPPKVVTLYPANHSAAILPPLTAMVQFNETVVRGAGSITLKLMDGTVINTFDMATLTPDGSYLYFDIPSLTLNQDYYIEMSAGAVKDMAGNDFAGISGSTDWSFNTVPIPGKLDWTYFFNVCGTGLPDGFYQYSVSGVQKWECNQFGYNYSDPKGSYPNGIQINGYENGANWTNEDWFITPGYDLSATQYPLLSFRSRTAYTGAPLQLKISTDYSGYGDPYSATWTDLDGKFPVRFSDIWTLSENINLITFKEHNVHLAFVYQSSTEEGARWTLDNIRLDNSPTPPPPSLMVNTTSITFPYVAKDGSEIKQFILSAFDLTGDLTLLSSWPFTLSKDGNDFSSSLSYTLDEASNRSMTVFVRFSPDMNRQNYQETVSISTTGASTVVDLAGSSINPETSLEVVNWNLDWFGSPTLGPSDDDKQQANVLEILNSIHADIYGLVEVVSESRLQSVVSQMPGYSYVISNFGSHTNPNDPSPGPLAEAQKQAFVYRTDIFSNVSTTALLSMGINSAEDITNPDYNAWSSGRFPYMLSADVTQNCRTEKVRFVLVHGKANTSPYATSYDRRKRGADDLHTLLNQSYPDEKVIILGDFNDDLDVSITPSDNTLPTSWNSFTTDPANFTAVTLPLSLAHKKSTASYNDVIDHVVVSNDMVPFYLTNSAAILSEVTTQISNYAKSTSDHYPVFSKYLVPNNVAPEAVVPSSFSFCQTADNFYTIPRLSASDDCGSPVSYSYIITGNTSRRGQTNNASGIFNTGKSYITWTIGDDWDNSTQYVSTVTVNLNPVVSIPDAFSLNMGVDPNTVYPGYLPASSITLNAVSDNDGSYSYEWSDGSTIIGTTAKITVSPSATTIYTVSVRNISGCLTTASKTIAAIKVSAGNKEKKVNICHEFHPHPVTLTIDPKDVPNHLMHGDHLGSCTTGAIAAEESLKSAEVITGVDNALNCSLYPNPSSNNFHITFPVGKNDENIRLRVINVQGVTIEQFNNFNCLRVLTFGENYIPGIYLVELKQGTSYTVHKIIKQ
jgi:hypothetical protein